MARSSASTYRSSIEPGHDAQDVIAARAYELWEESGYVHGQHEAHWRQAEEEVFGEAPSKPTIDNVTQIGGQHQDGISDFPAVDERPKGTRRVRVAEG